MIKATFFLIVLISIFFNQNGLSQETQMNSKLVPDKIKNYIKINYPIAIKTKYYRSIENDTTFIECDFKSGIDRYILKFTQEGSINQVEIFLSFEEFPVNIEAKIREELNTRFKKYQILDCFEVNPQLNCLYEINIKASTGKSTGYYEFYFDVHGNFIKVDEIAVEPITTIN